ncbi:MAG: hypothetical protein R2737_10215 [Candidatus Nanopelagicales bacterium]
MTAYAVSLQGNSLLLGPARITFMRTLRIPETGLHGLPPGLGAFPLRRVADYPDTAPSDWLARGGVMLPIYQREAMWLAFGFDEPVALQVAIGKVCAVSGESWTETLHRDPQNYLVLPGQPWLDGINAGDGFIRQFVAVPLGLGATVEGQVTGREEHGGIQLRAVGLGSEALARWREEEARRAKEAAELASAQPAAMSVGSVPMPMAAAAPDMGLGAGGRMRQEVYEDRRPLSDYDPARSWRVFVHLCSVPAWTAITGELPPPTPADRDAYTRAGLPWFDYFDADEKDLPAPETLARVRPVGELLGGEDGGFVPVPDGQVVRYGDPRTDGVADGDW